MFVRKRGEKTTKNPSGVFSKTTKHLAKKPLRYQVYVPNQIEMLYGDSTQKWMVPTSFFLLSCWAFCILKASMVLNCRSAAHVFVPGLGCHIYIELSSPNFYRVGEELSKVDFFFVV